MTELKPFGSFDKCPACDVDFIHFDRAFSYCTATHVPVTKMARQEQRYADTTTFNSKSIGHLHVTCKRCGYEWEEKMASAE